MNRSGKTILLAGLAMTLALVFLILSTSSKESKKNKRNLTLVFYNVENLFDTVDDPKKDDAEFLPGSEKKWDQKKYRKKLDDLSKVLSSVNPNELPEIIGLCEVETREVVSELAKTGNLAKGKYRVVHHESPDTRGIDCALLYRPNEFRVVTHFPVRIQFKNEPQHKTRDILYVKGKTLNREEFHIFVNHWPSRIGGVAETEHNRVEVARVLRSKIDSVLLQNPEANIVVMGDMNDEPDNISLHETLGAKKPATPGAKLVNLMFPDYLQERGSYYYRGNWNMLDNLVVSSGLLDETGFQCKEQKGFIFQQEWMEYKDRNGQVSPNRTFGGPNYYGGASDHFPVYFMLKR